MSRLRIQPRGFTPGISFVREQSNSTGGTFSHMASGFPGARASPKSATEFAQRSVGVPPAAPDDTGRMSVLLELGLFGDAPAAQDLSPWRIILACGMLYYVSTGSPVEGNAAGTWGGCLRKHGSTGLLSFLGASSGIFRSSRNDATFSAGKASGNARGEGRFPLETFWRSNIRRATQPGRRFP